MKVNFPSFVLLLIFVAMSFFIASLQYQISKIRNERESESVVTKL